MPQLDITINLIWFVFTVFFISSLYISSIYQYIPFFIKYMTFYDTLLFRFALLGFLTYNTFCEFIECTAFNIPSNLGIPYGFSTNIIMFVDSAYALDVADYRVPIVMPNDHVN